MGTADLICVRNLGLKETPGLSVTLHVTARGVEVVMLQLVVTADATQSITDTQPFRDEHRDLGALLHGDSLWEVMEGRVKRKNSHLQTEGSDFGKEWGKLTRRLSDLKSSQVPLF